MRSLLPLLALSAIAADWPQFLGPKRDNTTEEKVEPWKGERTVVWKVAIGPAHSSPVVAAGRVYAFYQQPGAMKDEDQETLAAFDAATGDKIWEESYSRPAYVPPFGKGPRSTPAVADGRVFTLGNTGILAARDAASGKLLWSVNTLERFKTPNLFFGISTSPIVIDGQVIVMVGGKGSGIVSFDAADGAIRWQATDDPASYSSPAPLPDGGLAFLTGSHLRGIAADGKELWAQPFKDKLNESSTTPLIVPQGVLGSSVTAGSVRLKIEGGKAERLWANPSLTCYFSTPVLAGDCLYMINGAATLLNPSITLRCVDLATGRVHWEREKIGRYHAAIVRTGNDQLLMLDDDGGLTLFAADSKEYRELAKSTVCGPTWAHPAIVDGALFLRDEKHLYRIALGER